MKDKLIVCEWDNRSCTHKINPRYPSLTLCGRMFGNQRLGKFGDNGWRNPTKHDKKKCKRCFKETRKLNGKIVPKKL